jgi:GNAT superfamily N-acetyltransferase
MPRPEIRPLADEHLEAAGALLADRHCLHRAAEPLLSPRYEDPAAARAEIAAACREDGAAGAVATVGGDVVGYVVGAPRGETWGPNVWVGAAGHAANDAELIRDLYAQLADDWVTDGRTAHYALVPATDAGLVAAWFRLGFGQQHAHGIREVPADAPAPAPPGIEVRAAGPGDLDSALALDRILPDHQSRSPVFSRGRTPTEEEARAETIETLADSQITILLAFGGGRVLGGASVADVAVSDSHAGLARPDRAGLLGWAVTQPEVRGTGVGVALTNAVFAWARERGYGTIVVDWRVTNLESSRFWPARGFRTTFLRLYRSIP